MNEPSGEWILNPPALPAAIADCEQAIGMSLPDDLRELLARGDGGERWFLEGREEPWFFLGLLPVPDIAGLYKMRQEYSDDLDLIPFASDGGSEYFYLDRPTGSILMIRTTGTRDDAAHCGGSVTEFLSRLTAGWDPFEQLTD